MLELKIDSKKNSDKSYVLSLDGNWIFRFVNSAFGSKWAGFWRKDEKYLDYWAFKIDDEWLSWENCIEFIHKGFEVVHRYSTKNGKVNERIYVDGDGLSIKLQFEKKKKRIIELEVGVDIRPRLNSPNYSQYELKFENGFVTVKNSFGKIIFGNKRGKLIENPRIEKHFPGRYLIEKGYDWRYYENEEIKFIPGMYRIETDDKEIEIKFYPEKIHKFDTDERLKIIQKIFGEYNKNYRFSEDFLNKVYRLAILHIFWLKDELLMAGLPYFNEYWTRDMLWNMKSMLCMNMLEQVRDILLILIKNIRNGKIPVVMGRKDYFDDVLPLFLIILSDYVARSGDFSLVDKYTKEIYKVIEQFFNRQDQEGLFSNDSYSTWMEDHFKRGKAIEIQTFWAYSLRKMGRILENHYLTDQGEKLEKRIIRKYFDGKFFVDNLETFGYTCNVVFPLLFLEIEKDIANKVINNIFKYLGCEYGIRTRMKDNLYSPDGYHTGSVWPFMNILFSGVLFKYGRYSDGLNILRKTFDYLGKQCMFAINEYINSENGRPLGCCFQGWSSIPVIWIIDEFLLGIYYDDNLIFRIKPRIPDSFTAYRFLKLFGRNTTLLIRKKDEKLNVQTKGYKLEVEGI